LVHAYKRFNNRLTIDMVHHIFITVYALTSNQYL